MNEMKPSYQRLQSLQSQLSNTTSQRNVFKRERDSMQTHLSNRNIRNQENIQKYMQLQSLARNLHGELTTAEHEVAKTSTPSMDVVADFLQSNWSRISSEQQNRFQSSRGVGLRFEPNRNSLFVCRTSHKENTAFF